jgi:hypothetical protein
MARRWTIGHCHDKKLNTRKTGQSPSAFGKGRFHRVQSGPVPVRESLRNVMIFPRGEASVNLFTRLTFQGIRISTLTEETNLEFFGWMNRSG